MDLSRRVRQTNAPGTSELSFSDVGLVLGRTFSNASRRRTVSWLLREISGYPFLHICDNTVSSFTGSWVHYFPFDGRPSPLRFLSLPPSNSLKFFLRASPLLFCHRPSPNSAFSLSHSFCHLHTASDKTFLMSVFGAKLGKTPAQLSFSPGRSVHLFAVVSGDAVIVSTATLSDVGTLENSSLLRGLHNHDLLCSKEYDGVVFSSPAIYQQTITLTYPHDPITTDDVAETRDDVLTSGLYAWSMRAMRAISRQASLLGATSPGPLHFGGGHSQGR